MKTAFLSVCAISASVTFAALAWHAVIFPRASPHYDTSNKAARSHHHHHQATRGRRSPLLPICNLESVQDANALENAVWVDPLELEQDSSHAAAATASALLSQTLVPHPTSHDMTENLKRSIVRVLDDAERLHKIARLQLDTQAHCRLKEWDRADFEKCMKNRRLIIVGDSMSMQQTESLSYLLDLTKNWTKVDEPERKRGVCRHCADAMTESGLQVIGRAIFHSDEEDMTPLRFNKQAWDIMVSDLGGWQEGDVLIANFGAHYPASFMEFRSDMNVLFYDVLAKVPRHVTVFWRDYSPAHFQSFADGEYSPTHYIKYANEPACVPHLMAPKTPSIYKHAVNKIIQECGEACRHIRRINTWDLLRNAWDQHTEGSHCFQDSWCDCRHYAIPGPMDFANVLLYNQLCVSSSDDSTTVISSEE